MSSFRLALVGVALVTSACTDAGGGAGGFDANAKSDLLEKPSDPPKYDYGYKDEQLGYSVKTEDGGYVTVAPVMNPETGKIVESVDDDYMWQLMDQATFEVLDEAESYDKGEKIEHYSTDGLTKDPKARMEALLKTGSLPYRGAETEPENYGVQGFPNFACDHQPGVSEPWIPADTDNYTAGTQLDLMNWFLITLGDPNTYVDPNNPGMYEIKGGQRLKSVQASNAAGTAVYIQTQALQMMPLDWSYMQQYMGANVGMPFWVCFSTTVTVQPPYNGAASETKKILGREINWETPTPHPSIGYVALDTFHVVQP